MACAIQKLGGRRRARCRRERVQVGSEVRKVADLVLDPASLRATRGGTELQLSPIGLKLLTILMRESPRVVNRQEIEREIWGNSLPDSDTLRSHLYNLRKTIDKPYDKPLLHTVQSAGYRIADIEQPPTCRRRALAAMSQGLQRKLRYAFILHMVLAGASVLVGALVAGSLVKDVITAHQLRR